MYKRLILFFFTAFFFIACTHPTLSPDVLIPANGLIVLGVIAGSPVDDVDSIQPLADTLASELSGYGISGGRVRVAGSVTEMAAWLKSGEVDLYFDSVYPALLVSEQSGAQLVLRGWQFGRPESQAVIFASRGSGLSSLEDLRGKVVAMRAPESTAGFFLPSVYLVEHGLFLTGKSSYFDPVSPSEVGFAFSGSDQDTLRAVIGGSAAAGAVDDYHYDIVFSTGATEQLVELARTEKIPRQVVLAAPGLDVEYVSVLTQFLTNMHTSDAGKAALDAFNTSRFEGFPSTGDAATARLREMLSIVKKIPLP